MSTLKLCICFKSLSHYKAELYKLRKNTQNMLIELVSPKSDSGQ